EHGLSRCVMGVARESVERKGWIKLSPLEGIWAVVYAGGDLWPLNCSCSLAVLSQVPRRILVCLDYEAGRVTFLRADTGAEIF
ncbi:TRI10 protein, partial [Casuarius casuarius]|nr:TRI10 protein [Casuarius casuarius]